MASTFVDDREFLQRINLYDKKTFGAAFRAVRDNAEDLIRKSGELAPVDEGVLLGSGTEETKAKGKNIEAVVGYNTSYAAKVHETMAPAPDPIMQPGPKTQKKPGNEFGEAGGKFLERPLHGKMDKYFRHIADKVRAVA